MEWRPSATETADHPCGRVTPLTLYGKKFTDDDLPDLPSEDLPPGLPEWMLSEESWAARQGTTPDLKRRTIFMRAPASAIK